MALVGLMQTLAIEGAKDGIRVNCLAPTAATRMTEGLLQPQMLELLTPESVTPGLLLLVSEDAPTRTILCAGAGTFARAHVTLTHGVHIGSGADAAERVAAHFAEISSRAGETVPESGSAQVAQRTGPRNGRRALTMEPPMARDSGDADVAPTAEAARRPQRRPRPSRRRWPHCTARCRHGRAWFADALAHEPEVSWPVVQGARIETLAWGARGAPGLLLLHGKMAHARWWSFIAPFFAATHRVVALSFCRHGRLRLA